MIYFIFALILFFLMFLEKQYAYRSKFLYYISAGIIFFLFSFRGINVGGDTKQYVGFFMGKASSYGSLSLNNLELGFNLFVRLVRGLSLTPFCFIFVSTLVTIIPFFMFVKRYGTSYVIPFLYILCFISFTVCIETNLRQNIAVGAFLLSFYIFLNADKDKKKHLICLLLLVFSLIGHNTNLIVIPLFVVFCFLKFNKKISIIIMAISYIISLITTSYFSDIFFYINVFFANTELFSHYSSYGVNGFYELGNVTSFNFLTLSMTAWPIFNIWACKDKEANNIFMKCMVLNCVIYNLCSSFPIAFRVIYLFQYLSLCYVPKRIINNKVYFAINVVFIISWLRVLFNTAANTILQNPDAHMFPYFFIWE